MIKGRRRSGKTYLLLSCLNEFERPYIVFNGRAFSSSPQVRREEFIKLLEESLNGFLKRKKRLGAKIVGALKHVQGLEPGALVTFLTCSSVSETNDRSTIVPSPVCSVSHSSGSSLTTLPLKALGLRIPKSPYFSSMV